MKKLIMSLMQGAYDEPNPLMYLKPSPISNRVVGRRKLIATNRSSLSNEYQPSLMINLKTGELHMKQSRQSGALYKQFEQQQRDLANRAEDRHQQQHVHYDIIEQYPIHQSVNYDNGDVVLSVTDLIESFGEIVEDVYYLMSPRSNLLVETPMLIESVQRFYQGVMQLYDKFTEKNKGDRQRIESEILKNNTEELEQQNRLDRKRKRKFVNKLTKLLLSDPKYQQMLSEMKKKSDQSVEKSQMYELYLQIVKLRRSKMESYPQQTGLEIQVETNELSADPWELISNKTEFHTLSFPFTMYELTKHLEYLHHNYRTCYQLEQYLIQFTEQGAKLRSFQNIIEHELLLHIYRKTKENLYDTDNEIVHVRNLLVNCRQSVRDKSIILCVTHILQSMKRSSLNHINLKRILFSVLYWDIIKEYLDYSATVPIENKVSTILKMRTDVRKLLLRRDRSRKSRLRVWKAILTEAII